MCQYEQDRLRPIFIIIILIKSKMMKIKMLMTSTELEYLKFSYKQTGQEKSRNIKIFYSYHKQRSYCSHFSYYNIMFRKRTTGQKSNYCPSPTYYQITIILNVNYGGIISRSGADILCFWTVKKQTIIHKTCLTL